MTDQFFRKPRSRYATADPRRSRFIHRPGGSLCIAAMQTNIAHRIAFSTSLPHIAFVGANALTASAAAAAFRYTTESSRYVKKVT